MQPTYLIKVAPQIAQTFILTILIVMDRLQILILVHKNLKFRVNITVVG